MKLQTKVNLLSTLLTFVIFMTSFSGIYYLYQYLAYNTEYDQLLTRGDELLVALSEMPSVNDVDTLLRSYIPPNGLILVQSEKGKTLIRLQATASAEKIEYKLSKDEEYTISTWNDAPIMAISYPMLWPDQQIVNVHLVQPLSDIAKNMEQLKWILLIITLAAIVPIYLASALLVRLIVKPIGQLTKTMQQNIKHSKFEQLEVPTRSRDEIADMTKTYNTLMQQLEENYMKQQQFVGNASHELKTPLTVIESYAKLLQRRGFANPQVNEEALTAITKETAQMKQLIEQMLQLAKASEQPKLTWENVSLMPMLLDIQQNMKQAYNRDIILSGEDVNVWTDAFKLKQLLFIFLDNARKYSEREVDVHLSSKDDYIEIAIKDYGVGIPSDDLPHIFDRFYRVNKDRNRKTGGTGLGLSIAKQLADLLKVEVRFESEVGAYTIVYLKLQCLREVDCK